MNRCDSGTDSIVWMKKDIITYFLYCFSCGCFHSLIPPTPPTYEAGDDVPEGWYWGSFISRCEILFFSESNVYMPSKNEGGFKYRTIQAVDFWDEFPNAVLMPIERPEVFKETGELE